MGGSVGPLELADDTRWLLVNSFFFESSCRSEASDPGGVAGATLVKIAIFSVNPVTKTGLVMWPDLVSNLTGRSLFMVAGQRMYMMHMLLLPFLPITALIIQVGFEFLRFINFCLFSPQNSITLSDLLMYQREVATIGSKVRGWCWLSISPQVLIITRFEPKSLIAKVQVDGITLLEKFITNLQKERAEVAFHIFTNGSKTLEMNLTTRWQLRTSLNQ